VLCTQNGGVMTKITEFEAKSGCTEPRFDRRDFVERGVRGVSRYMFLVLLSLAGRPSG
jgi:hypothetical protein